MEYFEYFSWPFLDGRHTWCFDKKFSVIITSWKQYYEIIYNMRTSVDEVKDYNFWNKLVILPPLKCLGNTQEYTIYVLWSSVHEANATLNRLTPLFSPSSNVFYLSSSYFCQTRYYSNHSICLCYNIIALGWFFPQNCITCFFLCWMRVKIREVLWVKLEQEGG